MAEQQDGKGGDAAGQGFVTVYLSTDTEDVPFEIHPGVWQVPALKEKLGISEQLVLVQIADPPVAYPDNGHVHVANGQIFVGQSRGGGAS